MLIGNAMASDSNISAKDSPSSIEGKVLQLVPYGSSISNVSEFCINRGWRFQLSKDSGFLKRQDGETPKEVGVSHIRAFLGDEKISTYKIMAASVYFAFDANGRLFDVWASKSIDAP